MTIVANYIPLEEPAGGPNFNAFDDNVLYAIHVDNNGDAKDDVTYQFRFKTTTRNPGTFLYNTGPITSEGSSAWNRPQTYTITRVMGGTATRLDDADYTTPVNIGPRSTPNYHDLEMANINPLSNGGRAFVGQRDDPFFVDTAAIFDLGGLRPFNAAHLIPSGGAQPGGCGRTANGSKQKPNGVYCRSFKWGALRCRAASGPREQAIVDRTPREGEFRGGLSQWHREVSTSSEESPQLFEFGVCAPSASVTDWA